MDNSKSFGNLYDDFFGNSKNINKEEKSISEKKLENAVNGIDEIQKVVSEKQNLLNKEILNLNNNELGNKTNMDKIANSNASSKDIENSNNNETLNKMISDFELLINELLVDEESKATIKKIIQYMKKYRNKEVQDYIKFNICIVSEDDETISKIAYIIEKSAEFFGYVPNNKNISKSLYNINSADEIDTIYNENSTILLKNFERVNLIDNSEFKQKLLFKIKDKSKNVNDKKITIISINSNENLKLIFETDKNLKAIFSDFIITGIKPDVQDVYQSIINKLEKNNELTDDFKIKLLDYVSQTFDNSGMSFSNYRDKLCDKILFSKASKIAENDKISENSDTKENEKITENDIPKYDREKTLDEIFAQLDNMVGLADVKKVLHNLADLINLKNKTDGELKLQNVNLHMVFLGNPGTGKTTVARIVAEILYNLKYVKENKLIEVSSKDLVGEYVGQTGPKTNSVIQRALGGVLFIDEAYTLASGVGSGNSYNQEAIATLIQAMENNRDNLVVIFAGYTKEMQEFLNANSGIVSRIGYTLDFKDYTEDELVQIFKQMTSKAGFNVKDDAIDVVREKIREYKDSPNFGNARFIRNLYEKTVIKHAENTRNKKQRNVLKTITKADISTENLII